MEKLYEMENEKDLIQQKSDQQEEEIQKLKDKIKTY